MFTGIRMWGVYKRHTPFAMISEKINIQDNVIRIPKKGDLLSYMYLTRTQKSTGLVVPWDSSIINSWKLYIGQELIDTQDSIFSLNVAPQTLARTYAKASMQPVSMFCPFHFWFCNDLPLPLVALQYDDVSIRMDWSPDPNYYYECYFNFILLGEEERDWFASTAHEISIYQVTKINSQSDVVLRNPVNFIASQPVKLPNYFTYGITINGKDLRRTYNSHGAQLAFHTEFSRLLPATTDPYPPLPMTQDSQVLYSPYGIGKYSISVSGNTTPTYAFNLHDGNLSTFWQTPGQQTPGQTVTYQATASSNVANAYKVFDQNINTGWQSSILKYTGNDPSFSGDYIASASINAPIAYLAFDNDPSTSWYTSNAYGKGFPTYGDMFTYASSNLISNPECLAFDGISTTFWSSNNSNLGNVYYMDYTGLYTINVSTSITGLNYQAYDGDPTTTWESNIQGSYGYTTLAGTYVASASSTNIPGTEYLAFEQSSASSWNGIINFGSMSNVTTNFNAISSSNNSLAGTEFQAFDGNPSTAWSSNTSYGYFTSNGSYGSNASYNLGGSYTPIGPGGTPWTSNTVYGNTFAGTYTIQSSTNSGWQVASGSGAWISDSSSNVYGYAQPSGTFGATASPSSNPTNAWQAFAGQGWSTAVAYGNIAPPGTYTFSSSVNNGTEFYPFNAVSSASWTPGVNTYLTSPPVSVANFTSTAAALTTITLSWTTQPNVEGYLITNGLTTNVCTSSPYIFGGLTSGTYNFNISAFNIIASTGFTSGTFGTLPITPTNLLQLAANTPASQIYFSWTGGGSETDHYQLDLLIGAVNVDTEIVNAQTTAFSFTSLLSATAYTIRVTPYNIQGVPGTSISSTFRTSTTGGIIYGPISISGTKYYIHVFTSSDTFGGVSAACDCLVIGGGGGGGFPDGGGGGAGRLVYASAQSILTSNNVTVGVGGVSFYGGQTYSGQNGVASSIKSPTGTTIVNAPGGGGGGAGFTSNAALAGGSGGGAGAYTNLNTLTAGGAATAGTPSGVGFAGGSTVATRPAQGGGGGGAGAVGGNGSLANAGNGGAGTNLAGGTSIKTLFGLDQGAGPYGVLSGSEYYFAGGGGGGYTTPGVGGLGGGGTGSGNGSVGTSGLPNTGGGGGGGGANGTAASSGGSGIVFIRYVA